ncbi:hypothetical protein D3C80_1575400 [compost metagenome]
MRTIARFGFLADSRTRSAMGAIRHLDTAWLSVDLEEYGDHALVIGTAHGLIDDDESLAAFDIGK